MEEKINRRLIHVIMIFVGSFTIAMAVGELAVVSYAWAQTEQTIIEEWASVKAPPPPALKAVTIDPKETAFLILDIQKRNCNAERRPRCVASVPKIRKLLTQARAGGVFVVYSLSGRSDILEEVAPLEGEPLVSSGSDKFQNTELEKILKDKGVKTVIVVGTSAHGAVLQTSTTAAYKGFKVIVPVEGSSAEDTYVEQYTVWHLVNAPTIRGRITLTKIDMIKFGGR